MEVAKTAWLQIVASAESMWAVMSWGVSKKQYTEYNGMPALCLRVSGLKHKGWVYVCLDEGADTYEIHLLDTSRRPKAGTKPIQDVYFDQLGNLIDSLVERGDYSEEEYRQKALRDSAAKFKSA